MMNPEGVPSRAEKIPKIEQSETQVAAGRAYHRWLKVHKRRTERHRARRNPECTPAYRLRRGYET